MSRSIQAPKKTAKKQQLLRCSYRYRQPSESWHHEECQLQVCAPLSSTHCWQHLCHDPAVDYPRCSNGRNAPAHGWERGGKRRKWPYVCWANIDSGKCYWCLQAENAPASVEPPEDDLPALPDLPPMDQADDALPDFIDMPVLAPVPQRTTWSGASFASIVGSTGALPDPAAAPDRRAAEEGNDPVIQDLPDNMVTQDNPDHLAASVSEMSIVPFEGYAVTEYDPYTLSGEYLARVKPAVMALAKYMSTDLDTLSEFRLKKAYIRIRREEEATGRKLPHMHAHCEFLYGYVRLISP